MRRPDYDRRTVEILLTAAWDESVAYGMSQDLPIDPMMPKAAINPAHGNGLAAMLADIHRALEKAPLSLKEKRALLLYFGMGWDQDVIGYNQEVGQRAISYRIESGVGRIVAWLNGDKYHEDIDTDVSVLV